jgi:hypothetical protein
MQENQTRAFKAIAYVLGIIVYLGGTAYAEARAYSLFARTIDPELLPIAIIGIVALGLTAIAAPIAHHFGTAPGVQRLFLDVFYAFDIFAMAANAVLDAAQHTGSITSVLELWNTYVLPALPLFCLCGWAIFFMLDPGHRRRDMIAAARAATEEVLTSRVVDQMKSADIADIVDSAARGAARDIVTQTVGAAAATPGKAIGRDTEGASQQVTPADVVPVAGARRPARDGRKPEPVDNPNA